LDTELARTFLMVVAAGSFISAAERLHVTQSTVSARIRLLEDKLGCTLFVRNKAGTTLTPAGRQFQRHASTLVRTVEHARNDIGVPKGFRAALTVGGRFGLWEQLLLKWVPLMRKLAPDVSVRAEIGMDADLMQGLIEGRIDIGVMYTPQSRPGLKVEPLLEERLVLVSTDPDRPPEPGQGYVLIDWGSEFHARHGVSFPDFVGPALTANIGWLGLQHVLANGGSGYFAHRIVEPLLKARRLHLVVGAPKFSMPAYVVYSVDQPDDHVQSAIAIMRDLAAEQTRRVTETPARGARRRR